MRTRKGSNNDSRLVSFEIDDGIVPVKPDRDLDGEKGVNIDRTMMLADHYQ